jgi:hypothetical protein
MRSVDAAVGFDRLTSVVFRTCLLACLLRGTSQKFFADGASDSVSNARKKRPLIKLIGRIHVRRQDQSFQFMSMVTTIDLSAAKAPDLELVGAGLPSPASSFSEPAAGAAMDVRHEDSSPQSTVESAYEQNAVAALLGLHTACVEVSSPDEDSREEDDAAPTGADLGGMGRWGDHDAKRWPHLSGVGYSSPSDGSPKTFRPLDYDTPGQSSPKRQRNPKDGAALALAQPRHSYWESAIDPPSSHTCPFGDSLA